MGCSDCFNDLYLEFFNFYYPLIVSNAVASVAYILWVYYQDKFSKKMR